MFDVIPERMVTGRLTDVCLDRLLALPLLGRRTLNLLVALLEPVLRRELLRIELLREEILLRLVEDLVVVVLVGALLMDRDEEIVLEELDLLDEGCRLLDAEEDLETCRLLDLLLDLLLLSVDFPAKTGSMVSIKAKNNVPTIILTFLWYFNVAIILLLKILLNLKTYTFETSSLTIKGTKVKAGNRNFTQKSLFLSFLYMENGGSTLECITRHRIDGLI